MKRKKFISALLIFLIVFSTLSGVVQSSNGDINSNTSIEGTNEEKSLDTKYVEGIFNINGVIREENNVDIDDFLEKYGNTNDENNINKGEKTVKASASQGIPESYDLRSKINITVEDQKSEGLCWAFATLGALRTHLALKQGEGTETPNLSEWHMNLMTSKYCGKGFERESGDGGNFGNYAMKYYKNNDGPVLEEACEYESNIDVNNKSAMQELDDLKPAYYIHETITFPAIMKQAQKDGTVKVTNNEKEISDTELKQVRDLIKKHIIANGGLYCSIRTNNGFIGDNIGNPYNTYEGRFSQYDDGSIEDSECGWHAVTIIGWDDKYSKEKFNAKNSEGNIVHPKEDGAYLVLNSYGGSAFEGGYQWISYEDHAVEGNLCGYIDVDTTENIYEYKFTNKSTYEFMKEKIKTYIEADDNSKTIKVLDLVINTDFTNLDFWRLELTNTDLNEIFKYNMKNLISLDLSNSKITDILPLAKLTNLTSLNLSNNNITDVSGISKLTNLKYLNLNKNKITDFSSLDLDKYETLLINEQHISESVSSKTTSMNYPTLFLKAKDKNDDFYAEEGFEFTRCIENSNGKGIILDVNNGKGNTLDEKIKTVKVKIKSGKIAGTEWTISVVKSNKKPVLVEEPKYYYSDKDYVYVLITADEPIKINDKKSASDWSYCNNEQAKNYGSTVTTTEENCRILLKYKRENNNRPSKEEIKIINEDDNATIVNIEADTFSPKLTVTKSSDGLTNKNVTVTVEADEDITLVSGENWTISGKRKLIKTYSESQSETIIVQDACGNKTKQSINVNIENKDDKNEDDNNEDNSQNNNSDQKGENQTDTSISNEEKNNNSGNDTKNNANQDISTITNENKDENLAPSRLPQTGAGDIIFIAIIGVIMIAVVLCGGLYIRYKKVE